VYAQGDTPEPLKDAFAALLECLGEDAEDGVHSGVFTEVFCASLRGIAPLTRAGRLPPEYSEQRVELLKDRLAPCSDTPSRWARNRGPRASALPARSIASGHARPHGAAADRRAPYSRRAPAPGAAMLIDHYPIRALGLSTGRQSTTRPQQRSDDPKGTTETTMAGEGVTLADGLPAGR
jgi:hypothetical protein